MSHQDVTPKIPSFFQGPTAQHRDNPYMELPLVVVTHEGLALSLSGFKWAKCGGSGDVGMLPLLQVILVKYFSLCAESGYSLFMFVYLQRRLTAD